MEISTEISSIHKQNSEIHELLNHSTVYSTKLNMWYEVLLRTINGIN